MTIAYDHRLDSNDPWISKNKAKKLMSLIKNDTVYKKLEPLPFDLATREQLYQIHDKTFVDDVIDNKLEDGFGVCDPLDMKRILATNGAMLAATMHAMKHGFAFAPVSGFHHAGFDYNGGFCTFNGLLLSAVEALKNGARNVCILDLDGHYGDGTDHIIKRMGLGDKIINFTRRQPFGDPERLMGDLDCVLIADWDLVIYQAGADSVVGDSLGAGYIPEQLWKEKDKYIFETCRMEGIPIVWNLAGGYSDKRTLMLHYSTWEAFKTTYLPESL